MKHRLYLITGLILLATTFIGADQAGAISGFGTYYATPSWDQTLPCTNMTNCQRFVVLTNMNGEAVLDKETGLVWQKSPFVFTDLWINAQTECVLARTGGRMGWRVPTIQELLSLVDPAQTFPSLPKGHPFSNVQNFYWSATTAALDTGYARVVTFDLGFALAFDKSDLNGVWCVRGGQGIDPQ